MSGFGVLFFFCFFSFCHFDPPLCHPPGAVWSHAVAFPRPAAATAGTQHNQRQEEGHSSGNVITVTAGGALLRDSRLEGGWKPSDTFCLLLWFHTPPLQSGPRPTVHPFHIPPVFLCWTQPCLGNIPAHIIAEGQLVITRTLLPRHVLKGAAISDRPASNTEVS